jgi:hypothetical protein
MESVTKELVNIETLITELLVMETVTMEIVNIVTVTVEWVSTVPVPMGTITMDIGKLFQSYRPISLLLLLGKVLEKLLLCRLKGKKLITIQKL